MFRPVQAFSILAAICSLTALRRDPTGDVRRCGAFWRTDQDSRNATEYPWPYHWTVVELFSDPARCVLPTPVKLRAVRNLASGEGFSADVSCRSQNLSNSTRPSLVISSHSEDWHYPIGMQVNFTRTITWLGVSSNCSLLDPDSRGKLYR